MTKITTSNKELTKQPKKYVQFIMSEKPTSWHRLVETKEGHLEYRMGVGKYKEISPRKFISFIRTVVRAAKSHQIEYLAVQFSNASFPQLDTLGNDWIQSTITENLLLASYEFTKYKTPSKENVELKEILICNPRLTQEKLAHARGHIVGSAANTTRDIANTTAEDMKPKDLAISSKEALKGTKTTVKILGEKELEKLKMGLHLAVGKGSENESKLILIEYYGAGKPTKNAKDKKRQPIVLIGKGITYDTGGLNIKPSGHMHDMHMDMSGGAAIIGAMQAIAKLKLKKNVIGIIAAAENAVSDRAMRAGDIVTAMNGMTVEVIHTDAEGRMVLADALTYSERYNPKVILDVATLTGASLTALGQHASATLTKDAKLSEILSTLGEKSGDYVWPLPLWEEYKEHIKSARADVANIAPNFSRFGGTIEGGTFLSHFAPDCPWAHIDMAPRMEAIKSDHLAKGATGEPVRLLVKFVENYS